MRTLINTVVLITTFLSCPINAQNYHGSLSRELSFLCTDDFGKIHILGSSPIGIVRATNSGTESVTITESNFTGAPEFVLTLEPPLPVTLQPDQFALWNFKFLAQDAGKRTAELKITSDASGSPHTLIVKAEAVDIPLGPWKWKFVGRPLGIRDVNEIVVDPRDDNLWYISSEVGLFITRDGGNSWDQSLKGSLIERNALFIDPTNPDRVYVFSSKGLYVSNDSGESWELLPSFPAPGISVLTVGSADGTIYIPHPVGIDGNNMNPGLYRSVDSGVTWDFFSYGIAEENLNPWDIVQDPVSSVLYVAIEIGHHPQPYDPPFFRSLDNGETWEDVSGILPWHGTMIQVDPENHNVYFLTEGAGLYKSSDQGSSWEYLSNFFYLELLLDKIHDNRLYGGAHTYGSGDGGAFMSDDGGLSFEQIGLSNLAVNSLTLSSDGKKLFATCLGAGIFITPVPLKTTVEQSDDLLPQQYALGHNFPNPFNPVTTITFDLPHSSNLTLNVYDILGQELAILASGNFPAGRFNAVWNATGFPSGIYFYKLQAGIYSSTRRLLLLK